jgi:hypothetical protein
MIVLDVDFNVMREMAAKASGVSFFYTETGTEITLYREFNGMLLRHVHAKSGSPQNDSAWASINLARSVRVEKISNFGEDEWKEYFTHLYYVMKSGGKETKGRKR